MILALALAAVTETQRVIQLANAWKLDQAEALARLTLASAVVCDDMHERARALDALGVVMRLRGNAEEALDVTSEAVALAEFLGDVETLARASNDLGRIHADLLGDVDAAREQYERALSLGAEVRALNNLGNLAYAEHDLITARDFYERAAAAAKQAKDDEGAVAAEHNIGLVLATGQDARAALPHFARAEELDRKLGGAQRARILLSRSEAERALGNTQSAVALLQRARKSADEITLATLSLREADVHLERRELAKAEDALRVSRRIATRLHDVALASLELAYRAKLRLAEQRYAEAAGLATRAAETGSLDVVAQASAIAGTAHRQRGNAAAAKRSFRNAIDAIEKQRVRVGASPEARLRFFERETYPYLAMMELSLAENDARAALQFAEGAKARVLRDRVIPSAVEGPPATVIEYVVTDANIIAFTITRDDVKATTLPIARRDLDALTARFARELALRNLGFRATARALYDLLLAPLALGDASRLVIVPDQELWRVAFHALVDSGDRYVLEQREIAYAPSLAIATASRNAKNDRVLLASSLPEAAQEIAEIGALWRNVTVLAPAKEAQVRSAAQRSGIVHIAAHGVYDESDPMRSHLELDDGRLTARELMSLRLPSSLVVLSACETGVGRPAAGEGVVGMSWALLLAGARAVVAGTWDVDSESTARLMIAFHRELARGAAPAAALRQAQLAFLRAPQAHPFYWAGFVVVGRGW